MRRYYAGGPVRKRYSGRPNKLWFFSIQEGITLVQREDGSWFETTFEIDEELQKFPLVLAGGYQQFISEETYQSLVAAGYGQYVITFDEYTQTYLYEFED
jgi:hypothetical protein